MPPPSKRDNFRPDLFPVGAARLLKQWKLEGRLFHPERWGGYIGWETGGLYPVFNDGRWITIGKKVQQDGHVIAYRMPNASKKLKKYGIDLMLQPRGWMTERQRKRKWLPLFENVNAGLYLRRAPHTQADLERVKEYYANRGVPFDPELGFDEQSVFEKNEPWANRFGVRRTHRNQFRMSSREIQRNGGRRVRGW